jgi:exodeoxyribonuclease-5
MLAKTKSKKVRELQKYQDQYNAFVAISNFIESDDKIFTLSGYAGTGKTYLIAFITQQLIQAGWRVGMSAPTNKAAKVLKGFSQRISSSLEAMTLARMLGVKPVIKQMPDGTQYEDFEPDPTQGSKIQSYDVVIVDEASMIHDLYFDMLTTQLDQASETIFKQKQKKIIFVGDPAQLPPVGEDESVVFKKADSTAHLKKIIRYDGNIIRLATHLRETRNPNIKKFVDNQQIYSLEKISWLRSGIAAFQNEEAFDNPDFARFLTWTNNRVNFINSQVREAIHGASAREYIIGERVIANKTCLDGQTILLNNSEEAEIVGIRTSIENLQDSVTGKITKLELFELTCFTDEDKTIKLRVLAENSKKPFQSYLTNYVKAIGARIGGNWKEFWEIKKSYHDVNYCYALTVHKSQGSTFVNAFIDIPNIYQNRKMDERNKLLYVAATRASDRLFLLG